MRYKKAISFIILMLLLLLSFFSCGEKKKDNSDKKIFHYNELGGISSLDPAASRTTENVWAVNQLFNGLVQMNDKLAIEPCIAKSWDISEDGRIYTFHLRNDVFFHEHELFKEGKGRKVTASDFVYSFNRLYNPKVSSALSLLDNIDKRQEGGFAAPDDSTFVVYLKENFSPFLGILTMKYFSVVPHEVVEHFGKILGKIRWARALFALKCGRKAHRLT